MHPLAGIPLIWKFADIRQPVFFPDFRHEVFMTSHEDFDTFVVVERVRQAEPHILG